VEITPVESEHGVDVVTVSDMHERRVSEVEGQVLVLLHQTIDLQEIAWFQWEELVNTIDYGVKKHRGKARVATIQKIGRFRNDRKARVEPTGKGLSFLAAHLVVLLAAIKKRDERSRVN
jgi:hypothetical protein